MNSVPPNFINSNSNSPINNHKCKQKVNQALNPVLKPKLMNANAKYVNLIDDEPI